jgi:hypothetical protein
MREYPSGICERLGGKFPGPTRQGLSLGAAQHGSSKTGADWTIATFVDVGIPAVCRSAQCSYRAAAPG